MVNDLKKIAIYLPQFHTIPENDKAWGAGFTEWTNVKKAKPLFEGHYQPHVPHHSVGYYDLRNTDTLKTQAELAASNGIHGFAYYHYWFNGKRLLHEPLDAMLADKSITMPFCYIWANENWTRRWDGADKEVIIEQQYSEEDDLMHIEFLCRNVFNDPRYILVDGKPLFLVYRTELFPDIRKTAVAWRAKAQSLGYKDIYLVRMENFVRDIDPISIGFDASMEFAPDWACVESQPRMVGDKAVYDYVRTVFNMLVTRKPYKYFRSVFPGWDNTARRATTSGSLFVNNDPGAFRFFLETQMHATISTFDNPAEQLLFINAWNEWGEGCHIEPDEKSGMTYLDICREAKPASAAGFTEWAAREINELRNFNTRTAAELGVTKAKLSHMTGRKYYKVAAWFAKKWRK